MPIYGTRTPRFVVLTILYGESKGWACETCPFCNAGPFPGCKQWIAHIGATHKDEELLRIADEIWRNIRGRVYTDEQERIEHILEQGKEMGAI